MSSKHPQHSPFADDSTAPDVSGRDEHDPTLHWMMQMLQTIEVGLFVLDKQMHIKLWNSFMENHSGVRVSQAKNRSLFKVFPDLPRGWLERKINSVFQLKSRAYSTWEQRPHVFRFKSARPLTSQAPWMFQNLTITPLLGADGEVSHVCVLVYDVTNIATNRRHLERVNQQLAELSQTDSLTGVANRGHWEHCLQDEFARVRRYQATASVILLDIDHFKDVNDSYGHQVGDEVLRQVTAVMEAQLRDTDIVGRYGGEEFAILLPNTDAQDAFLLAERLRHAIAERTFDCGTHQLKQTISLGIAELAHSQDDYIKSIEAADVALYQAKDRGRNRAVLFTPTDHKPS